MMEASKKVNDSVQATEMSNLMILAPHKAKYYRRYNIQWLIEQVENGKQFKYVTFWKADEGEENNVFSQWYRGKPFAINGRTYVTAEQYMMSEKALLFNDLTMYSLIMNEPDPDQCKQLGRLVKGFVGHIWEDAFREIIFHGNWVFFATPWWKNHLTAHIWESRATLSPLPRAEGCVCNDPGSKDGLSGRSGKYNHCSQLKIYFPSRT